MNSRRKLITWVDNKYVWKISGETNYSREWKLLYIRSADLKADRDCMARAVGVHDGNSFQDLVLSFDIGRQIALGQREMVAANTSKVTFLFVYKKTL